MKLHTHAVGRVSVVVLDQHKHMRHHVAATPSELWTWLRDQDTGFLITQDDWDLIAEKLDLHGYVHVETELDCDLVFARHFR